MAERTTKMTELHEVVVVRGPLARSGRGWDNVVRGQRIHVGSTRGEPALTHVGARGARLLARSSGPGDV
jgi:hypothetical protein